MATGHTWSSQPTPPTAAGPDRSTITTRLLETVRDRTGYPIETLGLDLDMEADLGIDSIKRVEILGKLRDEFPGLKALSDSPEMMDAMARARTLGVIVDRMASMAEQSVAPAGGSEKSVVPASAAMTNGNGKHDRGTLRRLLEVIEAPLPRERAGLLPGGRIVITDDGRGLARRLESQLLAAGVPVDRIGGPEATIDWTSPAAIDAVLDRLRSHGPLAGIVHALPMGGTSLVRTNRDRLVSPRRRRGQGAIPAGKSHGPGPGNRRPRGGSVPDRRNGPGRATGQ